MLNTKDCSLLPPAVHIVPFRFNSLEKLVETKNYVNSAQKISPKLKMRFLLAPALQSTIPFAIDSARNFADGFFESNRRSQQHCKKPRALYRSTARWLRPCCIHGSECDLDVSFSSLYDLSLSNRQVASSLYFTKVNCVPSVRSHHILLDRN